MGRPHPEAQPGEGWIEGGDDHSRVCYCVRKHWLMPTPPPASDPDTRRLGGYTPILLRVKFHVRDVVAGPSLQKEIKIVELAEQEKPKIFSAGCGARFYTDSI